MSATDFLPRREDDLRTWSSNMNARLTATPTVYGVTAAQAADYSVIHNEFITAMNIASSLGTRTKPSVKRKNDAMRVLRREARRIAKVIHGQRNVTNEMKVKIGLTIRRPGGKQTPIARPGSAPRLSIVPLTSGRVQVQLRNAEEPSRRGKPRGVSRATIYMYVGDQPSDDGKDWTFLGMTSRTKYIIPLSSDIPPGTRVWLTASWQNMRCESGPRTSPVFTHKPFGIFVASETKLRLAA